MSSGSFSSPASTSSSLFASFPTWATYASGTEPLNLAVAGLAIASIPPPVLFLIFQRQIISGITLTGIKG